MQVAQTDGLEAAHGVALLGEEDVVGLDALERDHPQRVVGKEVDEDDVEARLDSPHEAGRDGAALDHQHHVGPIAQAHALEPAQDPELVGGLGRCVLVEGIVAPVGEEPDLVPELA